MDTNVRSFIEEKLKEGAITRADLQSIIDGHAAMVPAESSRHLINVLYAIGAIIAIAGAVILVAQEWETIGFIGRVAVTLGIALASYSAALVLGVPERRVLAQSLLVISAVLAPIGVVAVLAEYGWEATYVTQMMVTLALAAVYAGSYFARRFSVAILLIAIYLSLAYYATIAEVTSASLGFSDVFSWSTAVLGAALVAVGYSVRPRVDATISAVGKERRIVSSILTAFGTLGFLSGMSSLGGVFDLVFIALIFGTFYLSVYLKSRVMLILAALYLIGHIFQLTAEYFVDSIGWPLALIITGFLVIGIGYGTFYLNRRFIKGA